MSQSDECPECEAAAEWLEVVGAVMDGRLDARAGIARLLAWQAKHPEDVDWLAERIEAIRWAHALDIEDLIDDPAAEYWDKVLSVSDALVEERVPPARAVALLERVLARHPEQREHVRKVIADIEHSPLWQLMGDDV